MLGRVTRAIGTLGNGLVWFALGLPVRRDERLFGWRKDVRERIAARQRLWWEHRND
jgi:hypothetical protein